MPRWASSASPRNEAPFARPAHREDEAVPSGMVRLPGVAATSGWQGAVRCWEGHVFTTMWIPCFLQGDQPGLVQAAALPVGGHWTLVTLVRKQDLTDAQSGCRAVPRRLDPLRRLTTRLQLLVGEPGGLPSRSSIAPSSVVQSTLPVLPTYCSSHSGGSSRLHFCS